MITTMRRKSRGRRMKNELGQGVDHFKRAASLAAQETSATVGPTLSAAVDRVQPAAVKAKDVASSGWGSAVATITPLVAAAGESARKTSELSGRKAKKAAKQNKKAAKTLQKRADKAVGRERGGRGKKLLGFALLGTAIGIAAAYAAKRRQAAQWDEYDPAAPITTAQTGADDAAFEPEVTEKEIPQAYSSQNGTSPNTPR
ncbi:hypothetical protein [Paractinoplanes brasiliensis]|uniref:Uncharacterized protein n=1 Tax=Paractinoplanes brasiliensis TaxID=52695 RepID=A0A4V6PSW5_9ACTN|nr:hypothetical protein [Actinoplanes brasiliensis]TDO39628.1 hypothetical protein C8E87_3319 [Actinoplanes brasiliensis]GID29033.1 hypothetical protein Abr02nite_40160 [Actinoplanes brasiliensis]